jgi:hypothetical protein
VAEELGDDDEVCAAAHERGRERVPEDVAGRVVVEAGGRGDAGDGVVGAPDAEALPALVENQGGKSVASSQSARRASQPFSAACSCGWIGTCRTRSPLPRILEAPLRAERSTSSTSRTMLFWAWLSSWLVGVWRDERAGEGLPGASVDTALIDGPEELRKFQREAFERIRQAAPPSATIRESFRRSLNPS